VGVYFNWQGDSVLLAENASRRTDVKNRTLIVEDDVSSRTALASILKILGHEVATAGTVGDALLALDDVPDEALPGAVLLDLMLPDGNGMEVLRQVRAQRLPLRVAILTGADLPMIEEARQLGPDAVFTKPVDAGQLLQWLHAAP
jgi:DNA-binding response OmpR family regulator